VLTYQYHSNETYKGRDAGGDFRVTRILVKRSGRWQMVGGQETRLFSVRSRVHATGTRISHGSFSELIQYHLEFG
jgi:hypothetical protein